MFNLQFIKVLLLYVNKKSLQEHRLHILCPYHTTTMNPKNRQELTIFRIREDS